MINRNNTLIQYNKSLLISKKILHMLEFSHIAVADKKSDDNLLLKSGQVSVATKIYSVIVGCIYHDVSELL